MAQPVQPPRPNVEAYAQQGLPIALIGDLDLFQTRASADLLTLGISSLLFSSATQLHDYIQTLESDASRPGAIFSQHPGPHQETFQDELNQLIVLGRELKIPVIIGTLTGVVPQSYEIRLLREVRLGELIPPRL